MQSLNCNSLRNQNQKADHISLTSCRIYITILKYHGEEILDQSKTGNELGKFQTPCLHVPCQSALQLLSSWQIWHSARTNFVLMSWFYLVSIFHPQRSHGPVISNILRSPKQFQHYSFLFQCLGLIHYLLGSCKGLELLL